MAEFKGTREAFAQAMIDAAAENDKIMFVSPDSLKAMRANKNLQNCIRNVMWRLELQSRMQ